jgi:hypothetical protein
MMAKNMLDTSPSAPMLIFDDRTGKLVESKRLDLADTLQFVYEAYATLKGVKEPTLSDFAILFAVGAICEHMGWTRYEIAAAEQYAALLNGNAASSAAG